MKVKRRNTLLLVVSLIFLISFTSSSLSAQGRKLTVGVGANTTAFLPLFVAQEKGFFRNEGLDVKITFLAGGGPLLKTMISKDVDIGAGTPEQAFYAQEEDLKLFVIWGVSNIMPYKLHARPAVKDDKELKGKIFAISSYGAITDSLTRYVLSRYGLDPERDAKILQIGSIPARYAALKSGAADITLLDEPFSTKAEKEGYKAIVDLRSVIKEWQYEVFYAMKEFLEKNDDAVKRFLRAYRKGIEHTKNNPGEAKGINSKYLGLDPTDSEIGYDFFVKSFFMDGHLEENGIKLSLEFEKKGGKLNKINDPKQVIDHTYINYFAKEK